MELFPTSLGVSLFLSGTRTKALISDHDAVQILTDCHDGLATGDQSPVDACWLDVTGPDHLESKSAPFETLLNSQPGLLSRRPCYPKNN